MLNALGFGAPPHGGIAFGFDRLVAMMCGLTDIREVIAFPKNKAAINPMDNCPTPAEPEVLKSLKLKIDKVQKWQCSIKKGQWR